MKTDNCKRPGTFRYASLGDVHLGNHQTPTTVIINNLNRSLTDDLLKQIDMLIITGDLYDRLLHNADENVHHINRWITLLEYRCAKYNVMIRIVEGTPSHDRGQSRFFVEQKINANIPVDLHYATTLSIEYNERLDAHFLYVPDKWRPDTSTTLEEVQVLLKQHGLEQVDFAIMHGAFEYQLPSIVKEPTHDSEIYLGLVKYHILIGHVHLQTQNERILAAGSFDRITHGEEGPKGFYDVTVREDGTSNIVFVENRTAKRYDTLECHEMDTKALNLAIRKKLSDLPKGSAVRLRCNPHDAATGDLELIKREFPWVEWSILVEKTAKKKESVADTLANFDLSDFIAIDKSSILKLILPELEKHAKDEHFVKSALPRLEEFL